MQIPHIFGWSAGPKPILDPTALYFGDNSRCFCGRHAGHQRSLHRPRHQRPARGAGGRGGVPARGLGAPVRGVPVGALTDRPTDQLLIEVAWLQ